MKKEQKIRSQYVKGIMEDRNLLENTIRETTRTSLRSILEETVKNEINNIILEDNDSDYEEQEVDDTVTTDGADNSIDTSSETEIDTVDDTPTDDSMGGEEFATDDTEDFGDSEGGEDEWGEFDAFKGDDDTYDFRGADDDTVIRVYKLLKDDDQVFVDSDEDGKIHITDNETGSEYLVDTNGGEEASIDNNTDEALTSDGSEEEGYSMTDIASSENADDMDEETVFEITLHDEDEENVNEADNLGYTTNYQKDTAMTTPSNNEPAKASQTYSMDKGIPTGTEKPYGKKVGDGQPFDKSIKEEDETIEDEIEEGTNVGGFVQQNSTSKSHVPNSSGRDARNASIAGKKVKSTSQPRYSTANEDIMRKANAIFAENKQLKKELEQFKVDLKEASILNYNLGQIAKLFCENTTSREEKVNIIKRFSNEANSIDESKRLFESISRDLKKVTQMNGVNSIDKQLSESKGNNLLVETPIYQSDDVTESLSLMKRLINL